MLVSYVLRLIASEAAAGRVVGELEAVLTGQVTVVQSVDDLVAFVRGDQEHPQPLLDNPGGLVP